MTTFSDMETVSDVETVPQDLLIVRTEAESEVLVPFVKAIVPVVDPAAGYVVVTPPAGLFEELVDEDPEPAASSDDSPEDPAADTDGN